MANFLVMAGSPAFNPWAQNYADVGAAALMAITNWRNIGAGCARVGQDLRYVKDIAEQMRSFVFTETKCDMVNGAERQSNGPEHSVQRYGAIKFVMR